MESQYQNPEFRNSPEKFHSCVSVQHMVLEMFEEFQDDCYDTQLCAPSFGLISHTVQEMLLKELQDGCPLGYYNGMI